MQFDKTSAENSTNQEKNTLSYSSERGMIFSRIREEQARQIFENEILLIDKPAGITSFGVVARVRRILAQHLGKKPKNTKIGHTGTLDPFATGLMILVVGKGTKRAGKFSKMDKEYIATAELGKTSTTGDPEGEISAIGNPKVPTKEEIQRTIDQNFKGEILQTPPIFSAIKINGERAYKIARRGKTEEEIGIPPRRVTIHDLEILKYDYPFLKFRAHVSSGTYIRTLAEDIAKSLKTGAYLTELRRTKIANYNLNTLKNLYTVEP